MVLLVASSHYLRADMTNSELLATLLSVLSVAVGAFAAGVTIGAALPT